MGSRKNAIAQGMAYDYLMAREHVNSCNNLIALLRHYFPEHTEAWWSISILAIDLNLFFIYHAVVKKRTNKILKQLVATLCIVGLSIGQILFKVSAYIVSSIDRIVVAVRP